MRLALDFRVCVVAKAALSVALLVRPAQAQPTEAGPAPSAAAPSQALPATTQPEPPRAKRATGPLKLHVETNSRPFDKAKLRAALAAELGRPVLLVEGAGDVDLQVELVSDTHATVTYKTPNNELLRHGVDLPPDHERSVQVVSWLTVNLVRDEASELLDELRARRKEEADARAAEAAAAEKAAADKAAADQAAADALVADKAAADKAVAEAARKKAEQAKKAETGAGGPNQEQPENLLRDPLRSFDVAFATPLSLLRDSKRRLLRLQLAVIYGEAGGIEGGAASPGVLRVRHDLLGAAVGTAAVLVGGNARGAIVAAGFSELDGNLEGVQLGGGAAIQRGVVARGAVISAGGAFAGDLNGALVGGGIASAKALHGVGLSGGINVIRGPSAGFLLSGGANFSSGHAGVEIAGGVNTARDLEGLAFAPVNVHRHVRGVQLGVVNVAEEVDGAAIGVLSIAKSGRVQPVLWTSIDRSVHVALKSIAGFAFTQIGAGIDLGADKFSYDGGAGLHLELSEHLFLEPGAYYSALYKTTDASGGADEHRLDYLLQAGFRVGDKLDFLVAGGVRHTIVGGSGAAVAPELRAGIAFF
jgi:hypothetical protein